MCLRGKASSANQTFLGGLALEGPNLYHLAFVIDEPIPEVSFRLSWGVCSCAWSEELKLAIPAHSHAGCFLFVLENHKRRPVHGDSVPQAEA